MTAKRRGPKGVTKEKFKKEGYSPRQQKILTSSPSPDRTLCLSQIRGPQPRQSQAVGLPVETLSSLEEGMWLYSHREGSCALAASGELKWCQVEPRSHQGLCQGREKLGVPVAPPSETSLSNMICYHSNCYTLWVSFSRLVWPGEAWDSM